VLELIARVEALLRRTRRDGHDPVAERFGEITIERACRLVLRDGRDGELAPLEYDLLLALYDRRGPWRRATSCCARCGATRPPW
jgi:DNA-binding response OmpR family regulator